MEAQELKKLREEFTKKLVVMEERLIRLELLNAIRFPEDDEKLETPEEIYNCYWDDIEDVQDYHGYSHAHLVRLWETYIKK